MLWLRLGWRNLWRNRTRTVLQSLAIAGGLLLAIFFKNLATGSYEKVIDDGVRTGSGHVGLYRDGYLADRKTEQSFVLGELATQVARLAGVKHVFSRIYIPGLVQSGHDSRGVLVLGIDAGVEKAVNPILQDRHLRAGTLPVAGNADRAVIGDGLAARLQVKLGNKIVVSFQDARGKIANVLYRVCGLMHTGIAQFDNESVLVDRRRLAAEFGSPDHVHEMAVMLADRHQAGAFVTALPGVASLPAQVHACTWERAMPQMFQMIELDRVGYLIFVGFLYLLIAIGTVNTLLMNVTERTREFGLLRAMGCNSANLRRMIVAEALVLGLLGAGAGTAAGSVLTWYYSLFGLDLRPLMGNKDLEVAGIVFDPVVFTMWNVPAMAGAVAAMVILVLIASLYPARKALKIRPAEAMRRY